MSLDDAAGLGLFLLSCVPLLVAALCAFGVWRLKPRWVRTLLAVLALSIGLPGTWVAADTGSYVWALHLESKWWQAKPKTRTEMESYLALYRVKTIQPQESMWGNRHLLKPGEQMVQYMILWNAPLDVVYDRDDRIVARYTSYE